MQLFRLWLAVLMLAHGVAHLPGFAASWRLTRLPELPYHTTLLAGRLDVGDVGMRVAGALWLAAALGFFLAAGGAVLGRDWWIPLAIVVAVTSLALCVLEWPASRVGVPVNLVILAALLLGQRLAWLAPPDAIPLR